MLPMVFLLKFLGEKASSPALLHLYAVKITEKTEWSRDGLQCVSKVISSMRYKRQIP